MIQLLIEIEEENDEIYVEMNRIDEEKETVKELDCMDDVFDILEYYVCGDEVEDTTNEIIDKMKNQGNKNDKS